MLSVEVAVKHCLIVPNQRVKKNDKMISRLGYSMWVAPEKETGQLQTLLELHSHNVPIQFSMHLHPKMNRQAAPKASQIDAQHYSER